jgi:hypothetical protein
MSGLDEQVTVVLVGAIVVLAGRSIDNVNVPSTM